MEAISAAALEPDDARCADAPSPWAIIVTEPHELPAPSDGYVDLFEGEDVLREADAGPGAAAAATSTSTPTSTSTATSTAIERAAVHPEPFDDAQDRLRADAQASERSRRATATPRSTRALTPEVLLVAAFLATGVAVAGVARWVAPVAAAAPSVVDAPARGAALAAGAPAVEPASRPTRAQRARPSRPAPGAARASLADAPLPVAPAEALPPAPAPEPTAVHDAAADAPLVAAPTLRSRAVLAAENAAAGQSAPLRRPRLAEPGCLAAALRRSPPAVPFSGTAKVRLVVEANGAVTSLELLSGATDPAVGAAIAAAISACRFVPGADAAGNPVALPHVVAIDFVAR